MGIILLKPSSFLDHSVVCMNCMQWQIADAIPVSNYDGIVKRISNLSSLVSRLVWPPPLQLGKQQIAHPWSVFCPQGNTGERGPPGPTGSPVSVDIWWSRFCLLNRRFMLCYLLVENFITILWFLGSSGCSGYTGCSRHEGTSGRLSEHPV